jgi:uncharacterized membrane protein YesL
MVMNPLYTIMMVLGSFVIYYVMMTIPGLITFFAGSSFAYLIMRFAYAAFYKVQQKAEAIEGAVEEES